MMQPIEYIISSVNHLPRQKPTQIFFFKEQKRRISNNWYAIMFLLGVF